LPRLKIAFAKAWHKKPAPCGGLFFYPVGLIFLCPEMRVPHGQRKAEYG